MKKYKFYLALALILSSFTIAKAETAKSNLTIKFDSPSERDSEILDPIDLVETEDTPDNITNADGLLRIDRTPYFNFGSPQLDQQLAYYYSLNGNKWSESLQISDYRYGYQDGWTLSAHLSPFYPYYKDIRVHDIENLYGTLELFNTHATNETGYFDVNRSVKINTNHEPVQIMSANEAFEQTIVDWFQRDEDQPVFPGQNDNVKLTIDATDARVNVSYIAELSWILLGTTPEAEN